MSEDPKDLAAQRARALYFQPTGFVSGEPAAALSKAGHARPLAGGPLFFTACAVHSRSKPTVIEPLATLLEWPEFRAWDERLSSPRPPFAGMSLEVPRVMGILNVTPDSFSDGGLYREADAAIARATEMQAAGADLLDVGGESTRPGADLIEENEELARVLPVIEAVARAQVLPVSIDSRKALVQAGAVAAGAQIINDVSALTFDDNAEALVARTRTPTVLMHAQGTPQDMQSRPHYDHVLLDIFDFLEDRLRHLEAQGVPRSLFMADPGIGFGKTLAHNMAILDGLALFHGLGVGLLLGASRKSFIGAVDTREGKPAPVSERLGGSIAAVCAGLQRGVQMVRVHDVGPSAQAVKLWRASLGSA